MSTPSAPKALGPYSQGIAVGSFVFVSGQLGLIAETGEFVGETISVQTQQALLNIKSILRAASSDLSHVVKTTVFLKNMSDFQQMNETYKKFFSQNGPVRSTIAVKELPKNALCEIECIAIIP
ncbi:MAG: Rid family detoxifying hydrolase [Patescibacteria group bacterium]|nr:Rid family detoxifying hydrolase [Patescibacteria group bacterium]